MFYGMKRTHWCYESPGMDSASEETPATRRKKKKNGMANYVVVKADRIDAIANKLKQKHGGKCSRGSTRLGQKLSIARYIPA